MEIIREDYDEQAGISTITVKTKYGEFEGVSKKHPEDEQSYFYGMGIAEARAVIKAYKRERKALKKESDAYLRLYKSLVCYKDFDEKSKEAKLMRKQIHIKVSKVNELAEEINKIQDSLVAREINRNALKRFLLKKDQKVLIKNKQF